jgi:molybdopterin-guanine dinucleotide biosynthesis protein A
MPRKPDLPPTTCEICILAGGLSSRMGRDKARIRLGRRTLLGHVRATANELGYRVRVIRRDVVPRCGPLGGILTGLISAQAESVLFLSCDMPFVTPELLRELIAALDQTKPASRSTSLRSPRLCGVFARSGDTVGFPLVIRREVREVVEELIATNAWSLQGFARRVKARSLRIPAARSRELANINTPDDLKRERKKTG